MSSKQAAAYRAGQLPMWKTELALNSLRHANPFAEGRAVITSISGGHVASTKAEQLAWALVESAFDVGAWGGPDDCPEEITVRTEAAQAELLAYISQLEAATDATPQAPASERCKHTGNPVGTDTWPEGLECPCAPCQKWLHRAQPEGPFVAQRLWLEVMKAVRDHGIDCAARKRGAESKVRAAIEKYLLTAQLLEEPRVTLERLEDAIGAALPSTLTEEQHYGVMAKVALKLVESGIVKVSRP